MSTTSVGITNNGLWVLAVGSQDRLNETGAGTSTWITNDMAQPTAASKKYVTLEKSPEAAHLEVSDALPRK
jgi:hypothetical protein